MTTARSWTHVEWPLSLLQNDIQLDKAHLFGPRFLVPGSNSQFRLELELNIADEQSHLCLCLLSFGDRMEWTVRFRIWLQTDKEKRLTAAKECVETISLQADNDRLYFCVNQKELFIHPKLTVCCEISLDNWSALCDEDVGSLGHKMLIKSNEGVNGYCVVIVEDCEFKLSKQLLAIRAPVFLSIFSHSSTVEAKQNLCCLPDVNLTVFKMFVRFLYTSHLGRICENDDGLVEDLYIFADKWDVKMLKYQCIHLLIRSTDRKNIINRLAFAHFYSDSILKQRLWMFLAENHIDVRELTTETDWKILETHHQELANDIKQNLVIVKR